MARLAPRSPEVALGGVLVAGVAVVAYALASRVWPATLAENEFSNRLGAPFQYWNAVGTTAAMCVPGLLWLGSRRTGHVLARSLAYPAMGACILAILLTQSRGALAAAVIAAIAWFAIVPLRLRSLPGAPGARPCAPGWWAAWALSRDPFTKILQPLAAKESVAGEFGLLILLMSAVLLLVGLLVNAGLARAPVPMRVRRATGLVALAVALAVPLVGLTSVAFSQGGLGGTIGDRVDELVSETDGYTDQGANRLTATSSTRGKYWREAGRVFDDRPLLGVGAGAFEVARLRHRTDAAVTRHAHGFGVQTLADLGLVGGALVVALLIAWLASAARATQLYPRRLRRDGADAPGTARLDRRANGAGRRWRSWRSPSGSSRPSTGPGSCPAPPPWPSWPPATWPAVGRWALRPHRSPRIPGATVRVCSPPRRWLLASAARGVGDLAARGERPGGGPGPWAWRPRDATTRRSPRPTTPPTRTRCRPTPLFTRADVQIAAGRRAGAEQTLEQAVLSFPGDPRTWLRLTRLKLSLGRPREADQVVRGALYLDPYSTEARTLYISARSGVRRAEARRATALTIAAAAACSAWSSRPSESEVRGSHPSSRRARPRSAPVLRGSRPSAGRLSNAGERPSSLAEQLERVRERGGRAAGHVVHATVPAALERPAPWPRRRRRRR